MSAKSISHCQGKGSITHNNRDFSNKNVDTSRTGDNVTYAKQPLGEAYKQCFGEAVQRYNAKQTRADRRIDDYYAYLFGNAQQNTVATSANKQKSFYETLVQIGTKEDSSVGTLDGATAAKCLDEYMRGFSERNPNFYVFNAVLHMDEATPHLHIDYIPVAHCKRGLDTQNGIAQALKEMGYGSGKDAVNRWRVAERKVLEEICRENGVELADPQKARGHSFTPNEYKEYKDKLTELRGEVEFYNKRTADLHRESTLMTQENLALAAEKEKVLQDVSEARKVLLNVSDEVTNLESKRKAIEGQIKSLEDKKKDVKGKILELENITAIKPVSNLPFVKDRAVYFVSDVENLKKTATQRAEVDEETRETQRENVRLKKKIGELTSENKALQAKIPPKESFKDVMAAAEEKKRFYDMQRKAAAFDRLPRDMQSQLLTGREKTSTSKDERG